MISLTTEIKRRKHIQQEFDKQNIKFEFFDALTPDRALPLVQAMGLRFDEHDLSKGELACFMSHVSLWQNMVDNNISYMTIFEDDIHLGQHVVKFLTQSDWIPKDTDIVKLEAFNPYVFVSKARQIRVGDRGLYELKSKHVGAAAYVLSQRAAKILLNEILQREALKPLDHIIFDDYIYNMQFNIFQVLPAPCIQDDRKQILDKKLYSALEIERRNRFKIQTKQKGVLAKIKKELLRILLQLHNIKRNFIYDKKKVEFR